MNNNDIDYESSDDGDSVPPPPSQTHHTSNYENLNDETDSLNDILSNNRDFRNNNNMSNNMINDTNDDYAFQNANTTSDLSNLLLSPNNNNNNNNKDIHHLTNPQLHGIHHAQEYDEEAAANEEIEVRGSSIVVTMSRREKERGMENFDEDLNKDDGAGIAHVCSRRKRKRCLLMTVAGCAVAALITGIVTTVKPRATVINRLEDVPFTGTDAKGRFASNQGHKSRDIQEDMVIINQEEQFTGKRTKRMYPGSSQRSNGYDPTSDDINKTRGTYEIARKSSKIRKNSDRSGGKKRSKHDSRSERISSNSDRTIDENSSKR